MLDVFQWLLETFVTPLTAEQLAAAEVCSNLLAVPVVVANKWKKLELCFSLRGTEQLVFDVRIHSFRYDAAGCIFIFRFGYIVVERVLSIRRSRERYLRLCWPLFCRWA